MPSIVFSPNRLAGAIQKSGYSKRKIAILIGHSNTSKLYRYLNGAVEPSTAMLGKLATAIGCNPGEFFGEAGE